MIFISVKKKRGFPLFCCFGFAKWRIWWFFILTRRKTADFNRKILDNFDNGGYTGSAFRVSKESAKIYRKPELFTDL